MIYRFGPFELNGQERVLRRQGSIVAIPPKALAALLILVQAEGRVLSKEELLAAVWPNTFVAEGTLTQTVFVLRRLLATGSDESNPIETVPRVGYRFRDTVVPVADAQDDVVTSPSSLANVQQTGHPTAEAEAIRPVERQPALAPSRLSRGPVILLLAVVLLLTGTWFSVATLHQRATRLPEHPRIAVVAFRDLSPDPATAWVSNALRELVSADLSGGRPQIVPTQTVARMEKKRGLTQAASASPESLRQLCADVACDELLIGTYLFTPDQVRLDTSLLDGRTGTSVATFHSTAPANDLLTLVDAVDAAMHRKLGIANDPAQSAQLAASIPANLEAYRFYEEGMQQLRGFDPVMASQLLERSIVLDPKFPLSHMELVHAVTLLGEHGRALEEAHKGKALAGNLSRVDQLRVQAVTEAVEHRFEAAAATYAKLFSIVPQDVEYARSEASLLEIAGHNREAVNVLQPIVDGQKKEPAAPAVFLVLGQGYMNLGDPPLAHRYAQNAQDEAKKNGDMILYERALTAEADALDGVGHLDDALAKSHQALQLGNQFSDESGILQALNVTARIDTSMGRLDEAQASLQQSLARAEKRGLIESEINILAALGRNAARQGNLRKAAEYFRRDVSLARSSEQPQLLHNAEINLAETESKLRQH